MKKFINNVGWLTIAGALSKILAGVSQFILAFYLAPTDFGLYSITLASIGIISIIVDGGVVNILIKRSNAFEKWKDISFTFNLLLALVGSIIVFLGAPVIAHFYSEPMLTILVRIVSLTWIINSFSSVPNAFLQINKKYKEIAITNLISSLLQGIFQLFLVLMNWGIYSLVISLMIFYLSNSIILIYLSKIHLRFRWNLKSYISIARDSFYLLTTWILRYLWLQGASLIIGHFYGIAIAGQYYFANNVINLLIIFLSDNVRTVLFATLVDKYNQPELMKEKYLKVLLTLSVILSIISSWICMSAGDILHIIYGKKWETAILFMPFLAIGILIKGLSATSSVVFQTFNNYKRQATFAIYQTIAFFLFILIGSYTSKILYTIISLSLFYIITGVMELWYSGRGTLNISILQIIMICSLPLCFSLSLSCSIYYLMMKIYYINIYTALSYSIIYYISIIVIALSLKKKTKILLQI